MTETELEIIRNLSSDEVNHINSVEIGELMRMATSCKGFDKLGNVLFDAITKAFALGYYRGSKKRK